MDFIKERKEIAKYMRKLYKRGLTSCSGGNVSMINNDGIIFITASQSDKSQITWKNIAVYDSKDNMLITKELKPSMEFNIHKFIYDARKDVKAIVHAHPVYVSVFSVSNKSIDSSISGEARYILGEVANIEYALMGTGKLAKSVAEIMLKADVAVMKNHGAISLGNTIFEAFDRMEVLENTAKIYYKALIIGDCNSLCKESVSNIDKLKNNA